MSKKNYQVLLYPRDMTDDQRKAVRWAMRKVDHDCGYANDLTPVLNNILALIEPKRTCKTGGPGEAKEVAK